MGSSSTSSKQPTQYNWEQHFSAEATSAIPDVIYIFYKCMLMFCFFFWVYKFKEEIYPNPQDNLLTLIVGGSIVKKTMKRFLTCRPVS